MNLTIGEHNKPNLYTKNLFEIVQFDLTMFILPTFHMYKTTLSYYIPFMSLTASVILETIKSFLLNDKEYFFIRFVQLSNILA